tara:strand:+ start:91 stop:519 length:429 start_codon:yes stop_codon:yes gene_type:complete
MNEMQPSRGALADMLTGRRGLNTGSAEALVRQIGQPPQTALPQSQPQTGMPAMPSSGGDMQLVTGRDGNKYQIVIDPKTGLQTFIPYREPRRDPAQMPQPMGQPMGQGTMPQPMGQPMPQGMGQGQPNQGMLANRLRNMLSA